MNPANWLMAGVLGLLGAVVYRMASGGTGVAPGDASADPHWDMQVPDRRRWGRDVLLQAWARCFPGEGDPNLAVLQVLQAQTEGEGWYGYAGKPANWKGSQNWGGVQCKHGPPCGADCFGAGDAHGDGTAYAACFKRYPDAVSGCADFILNALVYHHGALARPAAEQGDLMAFCRALRTPPVYFEGDSTPLDPHTPEGAELAAKRYAQELYDRAVSIAADLGEGVAVWMSTDEVA